MSFASGRAANEFELQEKLNAFILLIGFELNASIAVNRDLKKRIAEE